MTIALTGLSGVYSDPTHVLVDPDDTIHQQLALCFHAVPATADDPRTTPGRDRNQRGSLVQPRRSLEPGHASRHATASARRHHRTTPDPLEDGPCSSTTGRR